MSGFAIVPICLQLASKSLTRTIKKQLNSVKVDIDSHAIRESDIDFARENETSIQVLQFLFDMYKPGSWGWEIVETIRRLMMTGTLVLLPAGSVSQLSLALFVSLIALVSYTFFRPFIKKEENVVAAVTMLNIFITVFMGLLLKLAGDESFTGQDSKFIGWMMTVLTISVIILATLGTFMNVMYSSGDTRRRLTFIRTRLKSKKVALPSKHRKVTMLERIWYVLNAGCGSGDAIPKPVTAPTSRWSKSHGKDDPSFRAGNEESGWSLGSNDLFFHETGNRSSRTEGSEHSGKATHRTTDFVIQRRIWSEPLKSELLSYSLGSNTTLDNWDVFFKQGRPLNAAWVKSRVEWLYEKWESSKRGECGCAVYSQPKAEDIICYDLTHFTFMVALDPIAEMSRGFTRSDDIPAVDADGQMHETRQIVGDEFGAMWISSILVQRMQELQGEPGNDNGFNPGYKDVASVMAEQIVKALDSRYEENKQLLKAGE